MRLNYILCLVLAVSAFGGPRDRNRTERIYGGGYAFFEFAPASGAGMGTACACTTPTGAKGEAMTFTRASSGTCLKGNTSSSVANGDMVTCATNQPRVGPGGDGTGPLKLLVEATRTNPLLQGQAFDNASWTKDTGGAGSAPTVTADFAVAPDGTTTAERVQFSSTTVASDASDLLQAVALSNPSSCSVFIKGNGTSGTIDVCTFSGATWACSNCAYVSATWTRCARDNVVMAAGSFFQFGNLSNHNGTITRSAADVFAWGAQCEAGAYSTSYIATTSAAATRAAEPPPTITLATGIGPNFSMAATLLYSSTNVGASNILGLGTAGPGNNAALYRNSDTQAGYEIGSTVTTPAVSSMGTTPHRSALADNSGTRSAFFDGTSVAAPAASLSGAQTTVVVGGFNASTVMDGWIGQVCLDPSPSRCR